MQPSAVEQRSQFVCPQLSLAVYREIAAHLRQVEGVEAGLIPQTSQQFDYRQSQIGGLWICYAATLEPNSQQRVQEILDYYARRYGDWHQQK